MKIKIKTKLYKHGHIELKPISRSIEAFFGRCKESGKNKHADTKNIDELIGCAVIINDGY